MALQIKYLEDLVLLSKFFIRNLSACKPVGIRLERRQEPRAASVDTKTVGNLFDLEVLEEIGRYLEVPIALRC